MKKTTITTTAAALVFAGIFGLTGIAGAQSHMGHQDMSPEQYKAMQDAHADFDKKAEPLRRELYAKRAELDTLYSQGAPRNDPKALSLLKEMSDLDAKLYAARADMRRQMIDKGIPAHGGMMGHGGMGHVGMGSGGCPMMGQGDGGGMGHGMMRHGGGW